MSDHRRLGRALSLFDTDPLIGAGLPYWLPDGATVRHALEEYVREAELRAGYRHVHSPVLGKRELYEISGHWAHYGEDMFPAMDLGGEQVVLRPSLCPHHALIYRSRSRSHRDLPLRLAELGGMYRSEPSGSLGGLSRVRAVHLNDAHLFCAPEQVAGELDAALRMIRDAYRALGIEPARYRLSLPDSGPGSGAGPARKPGEKSARKPAHKPAGKPAGKYVAGAAMWRRSAELLRGALGRAGLEYERAEGEAAFYGPKIDVQVADAAGRESTLSTVQVDFHQPERFGLSYVGADGARHRPVMVHRSVLGSLERAVAQLLEHHGGALPAWLAPVQLAVLPVAEAHVPQAAELVRDAAARGLRAELAGPERGSLGARVREARLVPYQAVIGAEECARQSVSVRLRDGRRLAPLPTGEFLARVSAVVGARSGSGLWEGDAAA
ncbi:aminoacyl--tRNA ligase-related protein [Streptomyces sp. ODS28]|uniref:aminoacyl--tRNA ligase-related protein n=1 Tax=Streptomyces sp. ODS28 TaxID=3136688 RepID=UPI0031ED4E6F